MSTTMSTTRETTTLRFPVEVVCPACRGPLSLDGARLACLACERCFGFCDGFPDLIVGGRFDDPTDHAQMLYEESANADSTRNYWIPTFRRLWPDGGPRRLLSLGCGTGADVDLLCEAGYDCVGIDCGNRTHVWPRRRERSRFLLANGKHLPFEDNTFDGVFCGCVFPHVGVEGDSFRVTPDYEGERSALAREMMRVLRPGGKVLVSSPNRLFPFDIFHGRDEHTHKPIPYWPGDPFLLSVADYRRLFERAGAASVRPLPVRHYWGFIRSKHSLKGFLLALPVRFTFWAVSQEGLRALRNSPFNPWLVVLIEKGGGA